MSKESESENYKLFSADRTHVTIYTSDDQLNNKLKKKVVKDCDSQNRTQASNDQVWGTFLVMKRLFKTIIIITVSVTTTIWSNY